MISVILPFFNAEKTLAKAISSILQQSYYNFELILVNNNSADHSKQIATSFCDRRIRYIEESRQSVVHAFNTGLGIAQGKYIARMDADDLSMPDRLLAQKRHLDTNPDIGIVSSLVKYQTDRDNTKGFQFYVNWINTIRTPEQIENHIFIESPIVNPSIMVRRGIFEKYGSYQEGNFPEDYELWLRWSKHKVKFDKIQKYLLVWKDSETRLTRTDQRYSTEAFYRIKTKYLAEKLLRINTFYPKVWIWGAGRRSRKRAELLIKHGIVIEGYIDVVAQKIKQKPCMHFEQIPSSGKIFILSYVGNRGANIKIRDFLKQKGYVEAQNFILIA